MYDIRNKTALERLFHIWDSRFIIAIIIALGMLRDINKGYHDDWKGWEE